MDTEFEDQMEDAAIERLIEQTEQEILELRAGLSPRQRQVDAVLSQNRHILAHERRYILKAILGHYAHRGDDK
jgi:hypothetical protein